ncbi:cyclin-domain-containing protein [Aspergillus ambiguus]|uniref:putative cyclin-dependent protein kinase complex component n=1 Tax=Aspergillus ambiguus TaxID=176160 RepID=UPI003CCDA78D
MLGGAITPSESVYHSSSRHALSHHPSSHLEAGSSRSTSPNTTPTSSTAPPSTSTTAGSARLSSYQPQDAPSYITRPSHTPSHLSTRETSATATPGSAYSSDLSNPMSIHASHPGADAHPPHHASQPSGSHAHTLSGNSQPGSRSSPASPRLRPTFRSMHSLGGSEASSPSRIKIRDLSHIQSFASEEFLAQSHRDPMPGQLSQEYQYEISSMPVTDIIEMVAGLLTKITTTNDMHHEHVHRHIPPADGTSNLSRQATSVLAFHGKNVPSISILSYLSRIHKYCPTTYEVFLSLLIYFDRMTELVNKGQLQSLRRRGPSSSAVPEESATRPSSATLPANASPMVTPPSSGGVRAQDPSSPSSVSPSLDPQDQDDLSHFFVVDSFNIHRLVIAGVTCASKFFSDVFYTNSRYAKVGGLPLAELNHLELQFLLLNDFRLSIPVEELEAYGTMLVEFYAREVVAQQQQRQTPTIPNHINPPASEHASDAMYMRTRERRDTDQHKVRQTPTPP